MTESRIEKQRKQINGIINFLNDTDLHYVSLGDASETSKRLDIAIEDLEAFINEYLQENKAK